MGLELPLGSYVGGAADTHDAAFLAGQPRTGPDLAVEIRQVTELPERRLREEERR